MTPTPELASQTEKELERFSFFIPQIRRVSLIGGSGAREKDAQAFQVREGCELIIATPGRLADALSKQHTVLNQCNYVILDEADKMIGPGRLFVMEWGDCRVAGTGDSSVIGRMIPCPQFSILVPDPVGRDSG